MDLRAYLMERRPWVERALEAALPPADAPPARLHAAMRHLLFPGGKRIRPAFAMAAAESVGALPQRALPVAVAVELVHTYSLIHDDLPCMDDDAVRRGRPTVHVAFDEATAVLAGDALLAAAFEALAVAEPHDLPAAARLAALAELARAAGAAGLVGGQVDDLAFPADAADGARVESIHARKTAALFRAAIVGGALLAGALPADVERLGRFGRAVGVAFQIADDLLDAGRGESCSLLRCMDEDAARARAERLFEAALAELEGLGDPAEPLRCLARYAFRRSE